MRAASLHKDMDKLRQRCAYLEDALAYGDSVIRGLEADLELRRLDEERRCADGLTLRLRLADEFTASETEAAEHSR